MTATILQTIPSIARFIADAFVSGLWQGLLLTAAVAAALRLVPHLKASVRSAIWGLTFALAAMVPLTHFRPLTAEVQPSPGSVHVATGWGYAIAALWTVLMAVRGMQLLMQAYRLRRIWQRATPVSADVMVQAALSGCPRPVELCTSADVDSPSVIGFFAPRLLIPHWLHARVTPTELRQVVLHECEHLRRRDDWINLLQKIALVLFPLNPALLWVDRRLSLERELACDAGVIAWTTEPFDYARCLTQLAEHRLQRRRVALSLSAWSRQPELARRVHDLLRPVREMSSVQVRFCSAIICLGLTAVAVQMGRTPRLIAFTDSVTAPSSALSATAMAPVTPPPSPTVLPVVFHEAPHLQGRLLRAAAPVSDTSHPTVTRRPSINMKPRKPARGATATQPQLVLTAFEMQRSGPRQASRLHTEFPTDVSPSYAAVPFGDGWLIVQL